MFVLLSAIFCYSRYLDCFGAAEGRCYFGVVSHTVLCSLFFRETICAMMRKAAPGKQERDHPPPP